MTAACYGSMLLLNEWHIASRLVRVAVPVAASILTYFLAAKFMKMKELAVLLHRGKH